MASDELALLLQVSADISGLKRRLAEGEGLIRKSTKAMLAEMTDLQNKLEVAQARGNKKAAEGIRDQITLLQTKSKFMRIGLTEIEAQAKAEAHLAAVIAARNAASRGGLGVAFDKVLDNTRLKVLDSGVARVGLFGSALEALGPAGIAAAAGIVAVGVAFAGAREATKFADDISDTADRLHVTTDALQEYRYAIRAAGGEEKGADEALESFSVTLGKAQQGLAKSQRAFLALGFTKEQIKGFKDADDALKQVVARIGSLPKQQQDAIISQFGLDGIKQLVDGGADAMQRLRDEAHKVGVVMDAELVRKGGELNDKFETVSKVIDVQLKSALVDLAPVLLSLLSLMADLAKAANAIVNAFRSIQDKGTDAIRSRIDAIDAQNKRFGSTPEPAQRAIIARNNTERARLQAELDARAARNSANPGKPTSTLIDTSKGASAGARAPKDDTAQRSAQVESEQARAMSAALAATLALTGNLDARADLQKRILDAEAARENAQLDKQIADIKADKGISEAKRAELTAALEAVRVTNAKTLLDKKALVDRELEAAVNQQILDDRLAIARYYDEMLGIESGLATTAKARREIELKILEHRQDEERATLKTKLDAELAAGRKTKSQADAELASQSDLFSAQRRDVLRNTEGPAERFIRENTDPAKAAEDLQAAGVRAFENLADGLADAIVNAESLGDVAKNVFRQLIADILSQSIKNIGAQVFSAVIPGFAEGTNFAPGGLAMVGERGPELVNLPRGSQVIPNHVLKNISNMQMPRRAGSEPVALHVSVDKSDYFDVAVQRVATPIAQRHAKQEASGAMQNINKAFPARVRAYQQLGT